MSLYANGNKVAPVINAVKPEETFDVTPTTSVQTITPSSGKVFSSGTVQAMPAGALGTVSASKSISGNTATITPSISGGTAGYISETSKSGAAVTVTASEVTSGNKAITASTSTQTGIDVANYSTVSVDPTPSETQTATPTTSSQTILPSTGKLLSSVTIDAMPVGVLGVPYTTRSWGTNSVTIYPNAAITTTGYLAAQTRQGTGYTVTASNLTSGNKAITASTSTQTSIDVTNYKTVSVSPTPTESKSITENGTYYPSSGKYFNAVTVDVSGGGGSSGFITNKLAGQIFFQNGDGSASHVYTTSKTVSKWLLWTDVGQVALTNTRIAGDYSNIFNNGIDVLSLGSWGSRRSLIVTNSSYPNFGLNTNTSNEDTAQCIIVPSTNTLNLYTFDKKYLGYSTSSSKVYVLAMASDGSTDSDYFIIYNYDNSCFRADTLITMADRTTKLAKDITYDDELLVWNFDEGKFDKAKPLWIKRIQKADKYNHLTFSDGRTLDTISDHRIFVRELYSFQFPMQIKLGLRTFTEDGEYVKFESREVIEEEVEFCNIITDYHQNLFANGILTSCRQNNLYTIDNMKFNKKTREGFAPNQLPTKQMYLDFGVDEKYIDGMRLDEYPEWLFSEKDKAYFDRLKALDIRNGS